jgi:CRP-like cAMP-binding protein
MLTATKQTRKQVFPPGAMVIEQGMPVDHFFMVAKGAVDVVVNSKVPETTLERLGPGQFFGEVSLTMGVNSIAGVRSAADGPTELVSLSKDAFLGLMKSSPRMTDTLSQVAQMRMNETYHLIEQYRS